jgi:amino acid transporter
MADDAVTAGGDGARSEGALGFWSVFAIGVGGMVGGGIFAVLGLAVDLSHGGTPLAFLIAGLVALLTSYSYVRLSVRYPSQGGTVEFINQAFGAGMLTGGLNVLLWISYIVMLSLYSYAFGSFGAQLFPGSLQTVMKHVLITAVVLLMTALNVLGSRSVGKAERWIVGLKIAILMVFIGLGTFSVSSGRLAVSTWSSPVTLMAGGMVIFLAYEGFELIANTAGDVRDPERTLPRAFYASVVFVIVLYVLISIVAVGNLSLDKIAAAQDYALAAAAEPFLGSAGFMMITVAALLSTASAINATLYGSSRVSFVIAKEGELPPLFERRVWRGSMEGLFITAGMTCVVANSFNLTSISTMGSAGFLLVFAAVNWSQVKLHEMTGGRRWLSGVGAAVCVAALAVLVVQTAQNAPTNVLVLVAMVAIAFLVEFLYRRRTGRVILPFLREEFHLMHGYIEGIEGRDD